MSENQRLVVTALYILACFIGGFTVAFVELYSRYDDARRLFSTTPSVAYMLINATSSLLAFLLIDSSKIEGLEGSSEVAKVIIAVTGSMVVLRSSLGNFKIKGESFDAGVASLIQILLKKSERRFDQISANDDLAKLGHIMKGVNFDRAYVDLPLICLEKMESVGANDSARLGKDLAKIKDEETNCADTKSLLLGIKLVSLTGFSILETGISLLCPEIHKATTENDESEDLEYLEKSEEKIQAFLDSEDINFDS